MTKFPKKTTTFNIKELLARETNDELNEESYIAINLKDPGYRRDNKWHLFDSKFLSDFYDNSIIQDEKKWEDTCFLDKSYWGYYCWPAQIKINFNQRQNFKNNENEFNKVVEAIEQHFSDPNFIEKFIQFATIEETKGSEKFDKKRFHLFKGLFRNFGKSEVINGLFERFSLLLKDSKENTRECSHKLAAEMIGGLIRGCKYWPLRELKHMWTKLKDTFDMLMENLSIETLEIWLDCFSTSFVNF